MKKRLIVLTAVLLLTGCSSKETEQKEVVEEPPKVQKIQETKAPADPVAFVDDVAEEIEPVVEEADPMTSENISEYTFTNLKNGRYHCSINNDSYNVTTTYSDNGGALEGPYSYGLDFSVYNRVNAVVTAMIGYDDLILEEVCASLGVEDVDKDEWLGNMLYCLSRGQESYEDSTYYDSGFETLAELEQVMAKYDSAAAGYDEPEESDDDEDDFPTPKKDQDDSEDVKPETEDDQTKTEEEEAENQDIQVERIVVTDPDIYAFYVTSPASSKHDYADGLLTRDAIRIYLNNHNVLDKIPVSATDNYNYYLYVYGNSDVKFTSVTKMVANGMIGVIGELEYQQDQQSDRYKELYLIIPVEPNVLFSTSSINKKPIPKLYTGTQQTPNT